MSITLNNKICLVFLFLFLGTVGLYSSGISGEKPTDYQSNHLLYKKAYSQYENNLYPMRDAKCETKLVDGSTLKGGQRIDLRIDQDSSGIALENYIYSFYLDSYDKGGKLLWEFMEERSYPTTEELNEGKSGGESKITNLLVDRDGSIFAVGMFSENLTLRHFSEDVRAKTYNSKGCSDVFILKIDLNGNMKGLKLFQTPLCDEPSDLNFDIDGNIVLTVKMNYPRETEEYVSYSLPVYYDRDLDQISEPVLPFNE